MSALRSDVTPRPARRLAYLGGFFFGGIGLSALYATTGIGLFCPLRALTGWQCPFCGGTRMGAALLHGEVAAAWAYNPAVLVAVVLLAVFGVLELVGRLGGPRLQLPRMLTRRLRAVHPTTWLVLGLALGTVYTLVRNLA